MTAYRKMIAGFVVAVAACGVSAGALAADPTLDEVYQAVHQNRLGDAQSMMTQVLRDHPDSAKAHYVEAEVLARMNRSEDARAELARAEQIAPGLPFAKPEAVRDLQGLIDGRGVHRSAVGGSALVTPLEAPARSGGIPWGPIGLAVAAVALVLFLLSRARRPAVMGMPGGGTALGPTGTPYGGAPYPYGPAPVGGGPGIGSSIVGGLASGAALERAWWPAKRWRTTCWATTSASAALPMRRRQMTDASPTTMAAAISASAATIPGTTADPAPTSPATAGAIGVDPDGQAFVASGAPATGAGCEAGVCATVGSRPASHSRSRSTCAASSRKPSLVRRQSTSSTLAAHSRSTR